MTGVPGTPQRPPPTLTPMTTPVHPPAIAALHTHIHHLAATISDSRIRQLNWVTGELAQALKRDYLPPEAGTHLGALLTTEHAITYLHHAAAGDLRTLTTAKPRPLSVPSMLIRHDCLRILAHTAGIPLQLPPRPRNAVLHPTVSKASRDVLYRWLARQGQQPPGDPGRDRLLAVIALVLEIGASTGELVAMRLSDFGDEFATVTVTRIPKGRSLGPQRTETHRLRAPIRACLHRWHTTRTQLTAEIRGDTQHLLVSLIPGTSGPDYQPRPRGMPLGDDGLERAYSKAAEELNQQMAGRRGWEPLPTQLDRLRRSVAVEQTPAPCPGCGERRRQQALGLCKPCYRRKRWAEEGKR